MDLTRMILRDGDEAVAVGEVLDTPPHVFGQLHLSPETAPAGMNLTDRAVLQVVAGRLPDPGTVVRVIGPVIHDVMYPHTIMRQREVPTASGTAVMPRATAPAPRALSNAIAALEDQGALTSFWDDQHTGTLWAAATRPALATAILRDVVPQRLRVAKSRWSPADIHAATAASMSFPDPTGTLLSFGSYHGTDHQIHVTAEVREVTPEFAQAVRDISNDLLEITVRIKKYYDREN